MGVSSPEGVDVALTWGVVVGVVLPQAVSKREMQIKKFRIRERNFMIFLVRIRINRVDYTPVTNQSFRVFSNSSLARRAAKVMASS